jgi:tetratricopeptide (TPR) repeat protein
VGDNRVFKLNIKLGDVYQKSLDMDTSLKYFEEAYEAAVSLQHIAFQIDALIRIAEVYFSKGEIEASIEYGNRVENILKDTVYVEGKLDLSLYWLKVHYIRNDYYKAREIGNQAIKLCTEKHTLYKGRILNALARLYAEISSVEEHLKLLNQALECFEKENFLRGILGINNNIGTIYSDKLQNDEKALEYFLKVNIVSIRNLIYWLVETLEKYILSH